MKGNGTVKMQTGRLPTCEPYMIRDQIIAWCNEKARHFQISSHTCMMYGPIMTLNKGDEGCKSSASKQKGILKGLILTISSSINIVLFSLLFMMSTISETSPA